MKNIKNIITFKIVNSFSVEFRQNLFGFHYLQGLNW